jgi:hypothetical protein
MEKLKVHENFGSILLFADGLQIASPQQALDV